MAHTPLTTLASTELSAPALLKRMIEAGASDLHLMVGCSPSLRIYGKINKLHECDPLTPEKTRDLANQLMDEGQRKTFEAEGDLDFAYSVQGLSRFRVNVFTQRSSVGLVIRAIPHSIPNGAQLGLPVVCRDLAMKRRGLVLVTGPTGSGKSTTLAAILDYINTYQERHILTLEDPVEFIHRAKQGIVTQREIGQDCPTFAQALRRAMRQDPDIIMVGELRDLESTSMALTAAETGHLVFGTLHTTSASLTVDRLIDAFPSDAQHQVRTQVASTLQGIVSQCLVQRIGGKLVAAHEILVVTDAIRSMIRDGKTTQLHNAIQTGKSYGMVTLEDSLIKLVREGVVDLEEAVAAANRPEEVAVHGAPVSAKPDASDDSSSV